MSDYFVLGIDLLSTQSVRDEWAEFYFLYPIRPSNPYICG